MIPAEAVEAAVTAAWIEADMPDDVTKDVARRMIEAAAPHMQPKPTYRFKIRATGLDPEGYYYANWEKAQSLSVLGHNKAEATTKALAMLGTHPRFGSWRTPGSGWTFSWDAVDEEMEPTP